jgi:peroxiredoxin
LADPSKAIFRDYDATNEDGTPKACSVVVDRTGTVAAVTDGVGTPQESLALLDKASDQFEMAVER